MAGLVPLVAQTALEVGVVALAGWELWKLRTPKKGPPPPSPPGDVAPSPPTPTLPPSRGKGDTPATPLPLDGGEAG